MSTKQILESGWSPYHDGSRGNKNRYHFFKENENKAICGHAEIREIAGKRKFINTSENHNPKKFCGLCKMYGAKV